MAPYIFVIELLMQLNSRMFRAEMNIFQFNEICKQRDVIAIYHYAFHRKEFGNSSFC